jgi:hypothetical protein
MPLTPAQLRQFHDDGFLIVRDFFTPAELQPLIDEINGIVDDLAQRLHRAGRVRQLYADEGFYTRLTCLEREFPGAAVLVHIRGILGPALANLWTHPRLLDVVEQLLGPEIVGHPVWNLRSKTPINPLATVPWHQDTAYLSAGCEQTFQPTAWIPLIDANHENGTLQVVRGGHRSGRVCRHVPEHQSGHPASWYLQIPEHELPPGEIVTCAMPFGSVLLINQLLPHRSTENRSPRIRWSVDLRWQRPGERSGFEGIKDCLRMRSADPAFRFDWGTWMTQNRIADGMLDKARRDPAEEFNTAVSGPWLLRWQ